MVVETTHLPGPEYTHHTPHHTIITIVYMLSYTQGYNLSFLFLLDD